MTEMLSNTLDSSFTSALAVTGQVLVSWYKPIIYLIPFMGWAWLVSTIYDKDAARWYFKRNQWNLLHLAVGLAAIAMVILIPGEFAFWIALAGSTALLAADAALYAFLRNRDDRVPERARWTTESVMRSITNATNERKKSKGPAEVKGITMSITGPKGTVHPPQPETPEYEVRTSAEAILTKVSEMRGSRLDIAPIREGVYGAACMVDGLRTLVDQLPAPKAIGIIDLLKHAAGLETEDRRRKQQGTLSFGPLGSPGTEARVTTMGGASGMQLIMLISPASQVQRRVDELGLLPSQLDDLKKIIDEPGGVVLLAAPPHNGRTSTMYAMIRAHDAYTSNVQTFEMDPQATIEGVRQNVFNPAEDGAEYATTVRSILRRDPDVAAIAEMPDDATAKMIAGADTARSRIYLSINAESALQAIQIYCAAVGDQKLAAKSLRGVVCQRLYRKLSENARIPFQPTPEMLKKLGLPAEVKTLYRTEGMVMVKDKMVPDPVSGGTGYFGQVGAFAVHPLGAEEQSLIANNELSALRARLRQLKQPSVQQAAMQLVVRGLTSVEEVLRVKQGQQKSSGGKRAASSPDAD